MNDNTKRFQRIISLIGTDNFNKLQKSIVAVIGLGGVGGTVAISLARSGIGTLIILDSDKVEYSNINRQLIASTNSLDKYKTDVLEEMINDINPNCNVIKLTERYNIDSHLFDYKFDYLADCIDSVSDKIDLINRCSSLNIPFISSMGTALKMDIKKLEITKISKTSYDPLAKVIRKKARELGIKDFDVLSSTEEPIQSDILASYMPVTSTAGLMISDHIIKNLIK